MRNAISKKIEGIQPSGIRKFFDVVSEMPDAISLGVGEPDFDTPYSVREEGIYALEKGRTFYTSNAGLKELREEISRYLKRKYSLDYDADNEIIGYKFVNFGKMMDFIKAGDDANTAFEKAQGQYGRVADAVKIIDPRKE